MISFKMDSPPRPESKTPMFILAAKRVDLIYAFKLLESNIYLKRRGPNPERSDLRPSRKGMSSTFRDRPASSRRLKLNYARRLYLYLRTSDVPGTSGSKGWRVLLEGFVKKGFVK
jgi:hypothetical protein